MKLPAIGQSLDLANLEKPLCCLVALAIQPMYPQPGGGYVKPIQQVTLRPDKVSKSGFIRLGETLGDEAMCWIKPEHIQVLDVLGLAAEVDGKWTVSPIPALQAVSNG